MAKDLFGEKPRRQRRFMMKPIDAGFIDGMGKVVKHRCPICLYTTDWLKERSVSLEKKGRPCPNCNKGTDNE